MNRRKQRIESGETTTPAARFLRAAASCRKRDLEQLLTLCELVSGISELIHALQKERGASSIFLGSDGVQFTHRLQARIADSHALEQKVRIQLESVGDQLERLGFGMRFCMRVAFAFRALDSLPNTRAQIAGIRMAPQDAVKQFTDMIGCLLAVVFEVADSAADPTIARALVALVNFAQGKEYAGQERATGGALFSRGLFQPSEYRRLQQLIIAQEQSFRIFSEFASPSQRASFQETITSPELGEIRLMRKVAFVGGPTGELAGVTAEAWYQHTTLRIDAMKTIEDQLASDLKHLCTEKLAEAHQQRNHADPIEPADLSLTSSVAMLIPATNSAFINRELEGGFGFYAFEGSQPKTLRSILEVIDAQSRHIDDMNHELQSARRTLTEHQIIERAKALLMTNRQLSDKDAYALMRKAAMNHNKRIFEVAEALLSTADILER